MRVVTGERTFAIATFIIRLILPLKAYSTVGQSYPTVYAIEGRFDATSSLDSREMPHPSCTVGTYNSACWQSLNLSAWLTEWYQQLRICPDVENVDTRNCRSINEPWTTAFLRIAQNITGGSGCTELNACIDNPPTSKDINFVDAIEAARYRYICYNIYGKFDFWIAD